MPIKFVDKEMQDDYDRIINERKYTNEELVWLNFVVSIMEHHGRDGVLRLLRVLDVIEEIEIKETKHGMDKNKKN